MEHSIATIVAGLAVFDERRIRVEELMREMDEGYDVIQAALDDITQEEGGWREGWHLPEAECAPWAQAMTAAVVDYKVEVQRARVEDETAETERPF